MPCTSKCRHYCVAGWAQRLCHLPLWRFRAVRPQAFRFLFACSQRFSHYPTVRAPSHATSRYLSLFPLLYMAMAVHARSVQLQRRARGIASCAGNLRCSSMGRTRPARRVVRVQQESRLDSKWREKSRVLISGRKFERPTQPTVDVIKCLKYAVGG